MEGRLEKKGILPQKDFEIIEIPVLKNRINAAAWPTEDGVMLVAREVKKAAKEGEPDTGRLVQLKSDTPLVEILLKDSGPMVEQVVWDSEGQEILLEDPRGLLLSDKSGVVLGLTAVVMEDGEKIVYPTVIYLQSSDVFEQITVTQEQIIRDFGPGKNITPVSDGTFLFRQEGDKNNHRLLHFSKDEHTKEVKELGNLEFPSDLEWASWRIGTTMPPIPINENEYLMIFHGIKWENGKYIYSLGRAKLVKDQGGNLTVAEIDREPILTPDDFVINNRPIAKELHPELRRVVYVCGGMMEDENRMLSLFVNVGDTKTVLVNLTFDALVAIDKPLRHQEKHAA